MSRYSWAPISLQTPGPNPATMLLLTDGRVLIQQYFSNQWWILTPEPLTGKYETGTWEELDIGSAKTRKYYASSMLKDGRVFILGGEFTNPANTTVQQEDQTGEIFDPISKSWTSMNKPAAFSWVQGDANCCVLADGRVLFGGPGLSNNTVTAIWDPYAPALEAWVTAGTAFGSVGNTKVGVTSEETWILLQDGSVLAVNLQINPPGGGSPVPSPSQAERYFPATDTWLPAGSPVQGLAWSQTTEIGPGLSLPDGKAFCIGANGQTGVFDPNNAATPWTAGPALLPSNTGNTLNPTKMATDAPCCLLPNGLVLVCGGEPVNIPNQNGVNQTWSGSPVFYLYDPKANTMTSMTANGGQDVNTKAQNTWECCLLLLPTGQVLLSTGHNELWIMTLDSSINTPDNSWRPIVDSAPSIMLPGHAYTIQGRQLNGLSEGCSYGDDVHNPTNYPIVRITDGANHIHYCRTYNFSSQGIGSQESSSFTVQLPNDIQQGSGGPPNFGTYLEVIANGIPSQTFPVSIFPWDAIIVTDLDIIGQGMVNAAIKGTGKATITPAFKVWVEGFTPSQVRLGGAADLQRDPPMSPPTITISQALGGTLTFEPYGPILADNDSLPNAAQRFAFQFRANFQNQVNSDAIFKAFGGTRFSITLNATWTSADGNTVTAAGSIDLVKTPTPYFLHADTTLANGAEWWLSTDLRVFQLKENTPGLYNLSILAGDPQKVGTDYIASLINKLNTDLPSADSIFSSLPETEETSTLTLAQTDAAGTPVYNFALARVRYADTIDAKDVRVFFRLFPGAQSFATFDFNALYRSGPSPDGGVIPLIGTTTPGGTHIGTIPFFATPRVVSTTTSTASQPADTPNVQTLPANPTGGSRSFFFGACNFPDGPYTAAAGAQNIVSIMELMRGTHQCLVAEINFSDDPIKAGSNPSNSAQLAQRNILFGPVANPGLQGSRRAEVPFEIRPTPQVFTGLRVFDELVMQWDPRVPLGSVLTVFLPAVAAADIIHLADLTYPSHSITLVDPHTVSVPVRGGVTYLPVPSNTSKESLVGLMSLGCPLGIRKGQLFGVTVKQVTLAVKRPDPVVEVPIHLVPSQQTQQKAVAPNQPAGQQVSQVQDAVATSSTTGSLDGLVKWRHTLGTFHLSIPVSTKQALLAPEIRILSILRYIQLSIPTTDRWYPVFQRYVDATAGRVGDLGGDPGEVGPDPNGGVEVRCGWWRFCGRVCEVVYDGCGGFVGFKARGEGEGKGEEREEREEEMEFLGCDEALCALVERLCEKRARVEVVCDRKGVREIREVWGGV